MLEIKNLVSVGNHVFVHLNYKVHFKIKYSVICKNIFTSTRRALLQTDRDLKKLPFMKFTLDMFVHLYRQYNSLYETSRGNTETDGAGCKGYRQHRTREQVQ